MKTVFLNLVAGRRRSAPALRRFGLVLLLSMWATKIFAADPVTDFASANELYAKGKFAEAAGIYESILTAGGQSPSLLFNCGNAEFKAGHVGKAIAAYRQAELMAPRDPELRANLAFVRSQVQGTTLHESRWRHWVSSLTLNEGTVLAAVFFWLLFGLLIVRQLRPALAPKVRGITRLIFLLTLFSAAVLAMQGSNHFNSAVAVITETEATARSGPFEDAQSIFTAHDGAELRVLDRHDQWVQVTDASGKIGWFSQKQVAVLPGA